MMEGAEKELTFILLKSYKFSSQPQIVATAALITRKALSNVVTLFKFINPLKAKARSSYIIHTVRNRLFVKD